MGSSRRLIQDPVVLKRMEVAFDLYEAGQVIMRQNLRRRHPNIAPDELEERLAEWRRRRPGAEHGDGVGRPVLKSEIDAWLASRKS